MANFSFVKCDIGGEGKRWRLMVDTESYLTLADEDSILRKTSKHSPISSPVRASPNRA